VPQSALSPTSLTPVTPEQQDQEIPLEIRNATKWLETQTITPDMSGGDPNGPYELVRGYDAQLVATYEIFNQKYTQRKENEEVVIFYNADSRATLADIIRNVEIHKGKLFDGTGRQFGYRHENTWTDTKPANPDRVKLYEEKKINFGPNGEEKLEFEIYQEESSFYRIYDGMRNVYDRTADITTRYNNNQPYTIKGSRHERKNEVSENNTTEKIYNRSLYEEWSGETALLTKKELIKGTSVILLSDRSKWVQELTVTDLEQHDFIEWQPYYDIKDGKNKFIARYHETVSHKEDELTKDAVTQNLTLDRRRLDRSESDENKVVNGYIVTILLSTVNFERKTTYNPIGSLVPESFSYKLSENGVIVKNLSYSWPLTTVQRAAYANTDLQKFLRNKEKELFGDYRITGYPLPYPSLASWWWYIVS